MIIGISLALLFAGALLVLFNETEMPEIPIYLLSGILLSVFTSIAVNNGYVSEHFVEKGLMKEIAVLGLGILVFYRTSGTVLDLRRRTSFSSFKTVVWIFFSSFAAFTGISSIMGFSLGESLLFGLAASFGSTLMDSDLVREEARKNHIYGWITEDMNFFDDLFGIIGLTILIGIVSGSNIFYGLMLSISIILLALLFRKLFGRLMEMVSGGESEIILLAGIATFISMAWLTEQSGLSALSGIYASGLILADTEFGYQVRERFSGVKDFFTALSFLAIGFIAALPGLNYLILAVGLFVFMSVVRPLLSTLALNLQGYDLRTGFMGSIQSAQVSELVLLSSLILTPSIGDPAFQTVTFAFILSVMASHVLEDKKNAVFEKLFSGYELDPEKTSLPSELDDHVIIAGYDWKTRGLEDMIERDLVVLDYDLERIEEAEERGIPHILADLYADEAWEKASVKDASLVISAVSDTELIDRIEKMDLDAEKILVRSESDEVKEKLRSMVSEALDR